MAEPLKIDVHMHIYGSKEEGTRRKEGGYVIWEYGDKPDVRFSRYGGDLEDALETIQQCGFSKAVVVNLFTESWVRDNATVGGADSLVELLKSFNEWACELAAPHEQLVPFVAADPGVLPGEEGAAHLRDMVENHGAKGIKLHPVLQEFRLSDPRMWPIYETCVDLDIPVLSHSGPARDGTPFAEPNAFAEALQRFPNLKLIIAHMGGGSWKQATEIGQTYPNAYFDCSEVIAWTGGTTAPTNQQLAQVIKDVGADKVMLGTDFPWYDLDHTAERVMELPLLSTEEKESILGANAARILGL